MTTLHAAGFDPNGSPHQNENKKGTPGAKQTLRLGAKMPPASNGRLQNQTALSMRLRNRPHPSSMDSSLVAYDKRT